MRRIFTILISGRSAGIVFVLFLQCGVPLGATAPKSSAVHLPDGTLENYAVRVKDVAADISSFYSISGDDASDAEKRDQVEFENRFFAGIAARLPSAETVQWNGAQIEIDNRWLHSRLEDLKKVPAASSDRDPIVNELSERLEAITAKIAELENAANNGVRNKDEEKQKLAQILERAEYQAPDKKDKSALERWWESFRKWLQSLFPSISPQPMQPIAAPSIPPELIQALVIGLALAAIGFVIWRFAPIFRNRRKRKKDAKDIGERIILGEKLAADESPASLFEQAESMAREGNFRGAIRKGYIALLCELGDRRIVRLAQYKTNRDYLRDLKTHQELQQGVRELTSIFEDHWYGLAAASEEEWGAFRENYRYSTSKL